MKKKNKLLALFTAIFMAAGLFSAMPMTVSAADITIDISTVSSGGTGYTFAGSTLTLTGAGPYIITQSVATTTNHIVVNASADVTLNGVNIDVSAIPSTCAFKITTGSVELKLIGDNKLISGSDNAGLQVPSGKSIIISGGTNDKLTAYGGNGAAGIGGGFNNTFGNITISSGTVTATGGYSSAGIGGGFNNTVGNITINGGTVTATGGDYGAGIGSGSSSDSGGNITINSGTVTATAGKYGAGIGGGANASSGNITIISGTVTATAGDNGAGIGGGQGGSGDNITISGGTVTATGGDRGAGIGGGSDGTGGNTTISSSTVTATGGDRGAGIGGGDEGSGGNITINSGTVTAAGGNSGSGIGGGGNWGSGGVIEIADGSNVTALSDGTKPAIDDTNNDITPDSGMAATILMANLSQLELTNTTFEIGTDGTNTFDPAIDYESFAVTVPAATYNVLVGNVKQQHTTDSNPTSLDFVVAANKLNIFDNVEKAPIVNFDIKGHGTAIEKQTVASGDLVTKPSDPSATGYAFGGWYKESACTNPWNFAADTVTANTELFAKWTAATYAITVGTLTNGSITATPATAAGGATVSLTVTPASGYQLKAGTLKYNGIVIAGTTFIMPAHAVTITAEFELIPLTTYAITVGTLTNGSITASPTTAASGATVSLSVTPASGYQLKAGTLKYNGTVITGTTFKMPAHAVTITAEFELIPPTTYAITIGTLTNGSITATPTTAASGTTVSLTITPASGYQIKAGTLKYNGTVITGTSFIMPAQAVTITAEFEAISSSPTTNTSNSTSSIIPKTITVIETPAGIDNPKLISVTASSNAFDQSVEVRIKDDAAVKQAIEKALTEEYADILKDVTIFPLDISLYIKGTNTKVQPNAGTSVEITYPIPTEWLANKDNIKIVCIIDGKLQILQTKVIKKNGVYCVVFTASHFSPYAFLVSNDIQVEDVAAGAPITVNANPVTDDASPICDNGLPYVIVVIGITAFGIIRKLTKKAK